MPFLGKTPSQIVDPEVDIDGGTIDGVAIGSVTANAGAFTNLTATGTLTLPDDGISGDDVNGGTISNFASTGIDDNATSTAITIDGSQNVGVGTASPFSTARLQVKTGTNVNLGFQTGTTETSGFKLNAYNDAGNANIPLELNGSVVLLKTSETERMRIDSSGNLLVGTTSSTLYSSTSETGTNITSQGGLYVAHDGTHVPNFNRITTDGDIIKFRKDGTTVGSIGSHAGVYTYIGTDDTALLFAGNIDAVMPFSPSASNYRDNAIDLGTASYRFDDIYATNGTIQTSDINEKQDIEALSEAEQRVAVAAKALLRKFRWKSAVEEKGDDARIHFGIIAQDLKAAFEAEGLDAGDYGMFIHSTWTDEETGEERSRMGVRYSELLAFIIAAI